MDEADELRHLQERLAYWGMHLPRVQEGFDNPSGAFKAISSTAAYLGELARLKEAQRRPVMLQH